MAEGLASMATYGNGDGNTIKHYYVGPLDKLKGKKMANKKCKKKPGKK